MSASLKLPLLVFIFLSLSNSAFATKIIHYKNIPVTVELVVGEERSLQFGDHVQVGVSKGMQMQNLFRVQSAQGFVHILPYKEFGKQRIQVKRITDGAVILIDLVASNEASSTIDSEDIRFVLASENIVTNPSPTDVSAISPQPHAITPVELTRVASQKLYGPARLHKRHPGITEHEINTANAIRIFAGENKFRTHSVPLLAYRGGAYYLAAIYIRNTSKDPLTLNYLDINVPFTHATFQHHKLNASGIPGDSTVLYLVSDVSLSEALHPWTYYKDVKADVQEAMRKQAVIERNTQSSRHQRKK
jgi:integrating conjugative element protein (TIGR03749 family)